MLVTIDILRKGNLKWKRVFVTTPLSSREAQASLGEVLGAFHDACVLSLTCLLDRTTQPWLLGPQ